MKSIVTKKGKLPGKTVAIFAGIHGNETAGITILNNLISNLHVVRGTVHLVFGNPPAILKNIRYVESNLNRSFIKLNNSKTSEQKRATTLMKLLDSCDALLDLHAYRAGPNIAFPFTICEPRCHKIIAKFNVPFSISNISSFQAGSTNGYMELKKKIGIVLELGAIEKPEDYIALGLDCALSFLSYFNNIKKVPTPRQYSTEYLKVIGVYRKNSKDFKFKKTYQSFDSLKAKEVIAVDGGLTVFTQTRARILFPSATDSVGVESFWLLGLT